MMTILASLVLLAKKLGRGLVNPKPRRFARVSLSGNRMRRFLMEQWVCRLLQTGPDSPVYVAKTSAFYILPMRGVWVGLVVMNYYHS